ncbi:MAG TPA: NAD-dependent epimerase/dehydratase family protein [Chloroflexota bacterium]|jgi:UDP-glucose 4-epimerase|nr:NAD-dependent epimerase/dehydratase family protein [Chloroflexota bacterium]
MTILVTGASGLIGRHTVELLVRRGEAVRTFQRAAPDSAAEAEWMSRAKAERDPRAAADRATKANAQRKFSTDAERDSAADADRKSNDRAEGDSAAEKAAAERALKPNVEHLRGDVRKDVEALCQAAQGCRAVVHLAGRGDVGESRRDPLGYAQLNATGALHALQAARAANAVFVLASSQRVYPLQPQLCAENDTLAPDSPYGYAKWVAELWCRMATEQFGVTTRVLRFFSVYGPGQQANGGSGVVTIFLQAALNAEPLTIQSAGKRDFTDVRDVARGIALAVDQPADRRHRIYNVATGLGTSFSELARLIKELSGSTSPIEERLSEPPGRDLVADISRARNELRYAPCIQLREGLQQYIEWLRQNSA